MTVDTYLRLVSPGVYYSPSPICEIGPCEIETIKEAARSNGLGRARICTHASADDAVHEMLIAFCGQPYVRAHRHHGKAESFHIIEGRMTIVLFNDDGIVDRKIRLGPLGTGRHLYYRLSSPIFHTVLSEDDFIVFHEVTNGPFKKGDAEEASWAPALDDIPAQEKFLAQLS